MSQKIYRLKGYDYSRPRLYMVTLKLHPQAAPLSILSPDGKHFIEHTPLTYPFMQVITERLVIYFHRTIEIVSYTIMPNHLHILIQIKHVPDKRRPNLLVIVSLLSKFLTEAYHQAIPGSSDFRPILPDWHDSIAFTPKAVKRLKAYIKSNPERTLRRKNSNFCRHRIYHGKDGVAWHYYGNFNLIKLPTILGVECSRKIREHSDLWMRWKDVAAYISVASAGIGTFMSPCEKMVKKEIIAAGGSVIILLPEGISPYWHPSEEMEKLCAAGRVLYLTPFPATPGRISAKLLYERCHAGGGLKELIQKIACNIYSPPRE